MTLSGITLETVIEFLLVALIVFCAWQQLQLRSQRTEIQRLEAQVDILIALQDPSSNNSPNERSAMWLKLVALRRQKQTRS